MASVQLVLLLLGWLEKSESTELAIDRQELDSTEMIGVSFSRLGFLPEQL